MKKYVFVLVFAFFYFFFLLLETISEQQSRYNIREHSINIYNIREQNARNSFSFCFQRDED
jgi:hypothetical protein